MSDITINGVRFHQQHRKCCRTCTHGPGGMGHGPYWYAFGIVGKTTYIGKELPALVAEHLDGLVARKDELAAKRAELVQQLDQLRTQVQHLDTLRRALDGLTDGGFIDTKALKELGLEAFSKVLKIL